MKKAFSLVGFLIAILILSFLAGMFLPSFIENIKANLGDTNSKSPVSKINDALGTDIKEQGTPIYNTSEIERKTEEYLKDKMDAARKNDYNLEDY